MGNEAGEWIMHGLEDDDPRCVHDYQELKGLINRIGFLPLFKNEIVGFSVEEYANPRYWWSEDPIRDPWEWRKSAAREHEMAYGKFFGGKAGMVSLEWLPTFVNYRRRGRDFDEYWRSGEAAMRQKKVMDCVTTHEPMLSNQLKNEAGFGKGGEKNFDGTLAMLQEKFYLVISDFRFRLNKQGEPYGWSLAQYSTPEQIWGYSMATASYTQSPYNSYERIINQMEKLDFRMTDKQIEALIGKMP